MGRVGGELPFTVEGMLISFKLLQPLNKYDDNFVIPSGRMMLVIPISSNALSPMLPSLLPSANVTVPRFEHLQNAKSSMLVTLSGIVILVIAVSRNA